MEGRLGVVCFPGGMNVEWLEIDGSSWCGILLGTDNHSVAPCDRFSNGYGFQHSKSHISVEAIFDVILPVKGYWDG